ncbi:YggS family pyridoxal phosphate-dependent enzyme [Martelella alba]|uniref:Pyridoxal phosphate homeostasis protein n=1 Tax=Martelella alba TaxID=2590451 RepID=A0ABY2SEA2_9HYPH|nr:YggS family pyridoxal phosphate-dependent enzyme [Martelella alba]TKI03086.1 YggS family pyridoxal phosphate-dependent enzyme [Martelella alba]
MSAIRENLQQVTAQIASAARECGRDPAEITLLAVSKTKPVAAIEEAVAAGQRAFGENYVQEGVGKIGYFQQKEIHPPLSWHFIGPLQSNKSRAVAEHFHWLHTLDRLSLARRLDLQRPAALPALNVLIQVNISGEESKSGIAPDQLPELAAAVAELPRLRLRGLMAIPAAEHDFQRQLAVFGEMKTLFDDLRRRLPHIDTLSLGMTGDMTAAIAAGSTLVRIGTAIFGARDYGAPTASS